MKIEDFNSSRKVADSRSEERGAIRQVDSEGHEFLAVPEEQGESARDEMKNGIFLKNQLETTRMSELSSHLTSLNIEEAATERELGELRRGTREGEGPGYEERLTLKLAQVQEKRDQVMLVYERREQEKQQEESLRDPTKESARLEAERMARDKDTAEARKRELAAQIFNRVKRFFRLGSN